MLAWQRLEAGMVVKYWGGGSKLATERRFRVKTELESQGDRQGDKSTKLRTKVSGKNLAGCQWEELDVKGKAV